jgi:hypothetical protein
MKAIFIFCIATRSSGQRADFSNSRLRDMSGTYLEQSGSVVAARAGTETGAKTLVYRSPGATGLILTTASGNASLIVLMELVTF